MDILLYLLIGFFGIVIAFASSKDVRKHTYIFVEQEDGFISFCALLVILFFWPFVVIMLIFVFIGKLLKYIIFKIRDQEYKNQ